MLSLRTSSLLPFSLDRHFYSSHRFYPALRLSVNSFGGTRFLFFSARPNQVSFLLGKTLEGDLQPPGQTFSAFIFLVSFFLSSPGSLAFSMTRSIRHVPTLQARRRDARHSQRVSVISHSLHDCIGPNRRAAAAHLLRPPLRPPPTRRCHRHQSTPTSWGRRRRPSRPSRSSRSRRRRRCHHRRCHRRAATTDTPSIEKRPVLYAPAHTLYLACVLNAQPAVSLFLPALDDVSARVCIFLVVVAVGRLLPCTRSER